MQNVKKRQESTYEAVLPVKKYLGMNTYGNWSALGSGESRALDNWDIFSGIDGDYLKSRGGTAFLKKAVGATKRGTTAIVNQITWDVGSEEYLITQEGSKMWAQALLLTGNPAQIVDYAGGVFDIGTTVQADLFLSGDKLYVITIAGNYIIRWDGSVFRGLPMGLPLPQISTVTSANAGAITGSYTLGLELVYQVAGVDIMASTPNRKVITTRILAVTGSISLKKIKLVIDATVLDANAVWTHIRVWRSKNKDSDRTNPLQPLDPQGNDDELYEEALITKAEMGAVALTAISTAAVSGHNMPPGNVGVTAGKPAGVYTIELNNSDAVFFNLIGIEEIELLPLPAAMTGCFCGNRVFVSGIFDSSLDDDSKNNIWYSSYAGTKYAFQYNPLNFIDTGRDGQNMIKLMAFEKDLIGIKEAKTGRLPSGNVDLQFQVLDEHIGIKNKNMAAFVPTVGVAAITNDFGDFRIFDYSLRWTNILNGIDISLPVRTLTSAITVASVSFAYVNGKLIVWGGLYGLVLHVKEKRGWTQYVTAMATNSQRIFTFAQGTRVAVVAISTHLVEMEVTATDGDVNTSNDTNSTTFLCAESTYCFRSRDGRDVLQHACLSVRASTSTQISCAPRVNQLYWPAPLTTPTVYATPNPSVYAVGSILSDREYQIYVSPGTVGALKWCPMAGNYLSYDLNVYSPATMRSKELHCIVDENGMGYGAFDPFASFPTTNTDPTWAQ